ncbi:membrane protein insertase YidC [Oceanisphaera pacifica]|uniref:Membrane protein insertase YidC n=1 Tax=Oceanisphaera pacifica TaxID=2818389 RepID=A0ABS3NIA9_9GAMM|nr:membrane protein insertase YidC [Oceanisphaera pacifica]MBO1520326.1 membrane protein insertase YidC [Oceanisphaera pacifica]
MESQRNILIIALLLVSFLIWQQWTTKDAQPETAQQSSQTTQVQASQGDGDFIPQGDLANGEGEVPTDTSATTAKQNLITVVSDTLKLTIDTQGGDVVRAELLEHDDSLDSDDKFVLLANNANFVNVAQSGLIGRDGPDSNIAGRPIYHSKQQQYVLADGQDSLTVPMTFTNDKGVVFTKNFTLTRDSHVVNVSYAINNQSGEPVQAQLYGQLKQSVNSPDGKSGNMLMASAYRGPAYSSDETRYTKYDFKKVQEANLNQSTEAGWVAMLQHYFVSAWIAPKQEQNQLYSSALNNRGQAAIGFKAPLVTVAPGTEQTLSADLWLGPKLQKKMAAAADNLDLTVDYGWLWFIAQPLFKLLHFLQSFAVNWGLAIILTTFVVRGVMYPLTKAQYTSMAKMRMLQPKLKELKERYGSDRQKMSQGMMELYKKEKVNPLGGCLPILVQMPIFISLYWVLMESVELRHAPFILWIEDLSVRDPYFVLPVLMGASMFLIQKMSPTTVTDPMQQKVMQFMPIIFTFFFLWFPAGLTLYWLVSNVVTITQQWYIFRQLEKKGLHGNKNKAES